MTKSYKTQRQARLQDQYTRDLHTAENRTQEYCNALLLNVEALQEQFRNDFASCDVNMTKQEKYMLVMQRYHHTISTLANEIDTFINKHSVHITFVLDAEKAQELAPDLTYKQVIRINTALVSLHKILTATFNN